MRAILLVFVILGSGGALGQTKIERLDKSQLPKSISIPEKIVSIQMWDDNNGTDKVRKD